MHVVCVHVQSAHILPCDPPPVGDLHWLLVGALIQISMMVPPNTGQTTSSNKSPSFYYISWPASTPIAESKQSPLSEVATLLCFATSVDGRNLDQSHDSRISLCLLQKTPDSFLQTSPRPRIAWLVCSYLQRSNHSSHAFKVSLTNSSITVVVLSGATKWQA